MMTPHEQRLCEAQAELFALSVQKFPCGSAFFVSRFMYSDSAKRLDKNDDPYNYVTADALLAAMEAAYPSLQEKRGEPIPEKVMKWMGYMYRAWNIIKRKGSPSIYKAIKAERMVSLYDSFHTFSPEYCVDQLEQLAQEGRGPVLSDYEVFRKIRLGK